MNTAPQTQTPTQRLASHLLGFPVTDWIAARREAGRTWRVIARELHEQTGIDITPETARLWGSRDVAA